MGSHSVIDILPLPEDVLYTLELLKKQLGKDSDLVATAHVVLNSLYQTEDSPIPEPTTTAYLVEDAEIEFTWDFHHQQFTLVVSGPNCVSWHSERTDRSQYMGEEEITSAQAAEGLTMLWRLAALKTFYH